MAGFGAYRELAQNRTLLTSLIVLLLMLCTGRTLAGTYSGGDGSPEDPYRIATAEDLNDIGNHIEDFNKCFVLVNDINLADYNGAQFNIIGPNSSKPFSGVFDGNGHTISNFACAAPGRNYVALFGCVHGASAKVMNLGVLDPNICDSNSDSLGSLVARLIGATISGCWVKGGIISGGWHVGGLVGKSDYYSKIFNSYSVTSVSGKWHVGGLVGISEAGSKIINSYSVSTVSGTDSYDYDYVGGLIGRSSSDISNSYSAGSVRGKGGHSTAGGLVGSNNSGGIFDCYSTASVTGTDYVGGLVGNNMGTGFSGYIINCYSAGSVDCRTGSCRYVGGLVGSNYKDYEMILNSFWDVGTSGQSNSDGGTGLTTPQMYDANTFLGAGWDFIRETENGPADTWTQPTGGGYPMLWWQLDPLPPLPSFSGGTGESGDPYLISNADELNSIGHNPRLMGVHFQLTKDIDLKGINFFSIGNDLFPFQGVFDGNDHSISNFALTCSEADCSGLFCYIDSANAEIRDVGLTDPNVDAPHAKKAGPLVCFLNSGTITGCYVDGGRVSGTHAVGSLVAYNNKGHILNCWSTASVCGSNRVGGLVADNANEGHISACWWAGSISGDWFVGGLVGFNSGSISDCCARGETSGVALVGGLVGYNEDGNISNCYAQTSVTGGGDVGGLVGESYYGGNISGCHATGNVEGGGRVGGMVGANKGNITCSYSAGSVTGTSYHVGGLVGLDDGGIRYCYSRACVMGYQDVGGLVGKNSSGNISNCYARGATSGVAKVGGLVGWNMGDISYSYSAGGVEGHAGVGGLVGDNWRNVASNTFWDMNTSGQSKSDGGSGKTTTEMKKQSTFADVGWDFATPIWTIDEGNDYPRLWWELPPLGAELCIFPPVMSRSGPLAQILASLRLPEDITKEQVDSNEPLVLYPGQIAASSQYVFELPPWQPRNVVVVGIFNKAELMDAVSDNGKVELEVTGKLTTGQGFFGTDNVWIIGRDIRCLVGFALHWLDSDCADPDWCDGFDLDHDGVVNFVDFALTDGCQIQDMQE